MPKTTYILGAGASMPFGLPSGATLKNAIIDIAANGIHPENAAHPSWPREAIFPGTDLADLELFASQFRMSGQDSIDSFLRMRPEFVDVGKRAIVAHLLPAERSVSFAEGGDWLDYLFNEVDFPGEPSRLTEVSFVTFNYDRLVEHYLHSRLMNSL